MATRAYVTRDPSPLEQRKDKLAKLVSEGVPVHEAGQAYMGLTKGQTARVWASIRAGLGWQAC